MIYIDENLTIDAQDAERSVADMARYINGLVEKLNAALIEIDERLQELEG